MEVGRCLVGAWSLSSCVSRCGAVSGLVFFCRWGLCSCLWWSALSVMLMSSSGGGVGWFWYVLWRWLVGVVISSCARRVISDRLRFVS